MYEIDDFCYEYSSRGLIAKSDQATKDKEFDEDPPMDSTDFNENNAVLLSSVKIKKVPKCILQGYSSNNTVYYDVVVSFAIWREGSNIEDLEPRMELPTEDSEQYPIPQEPS